jgi:hypothetical protein
MHMEVGFVYDEQRLSSSFYRDQRSVQINGSYINKHFYRQKRILRKCDGAVAGRET